jgi:hypothetical protein
VDPGIALMMKIAVVVTSLNEFSGDAKGEGGYIGRRRLC